MMCWNWLHASNALCLYSCSQITSEGLKFFAISFFFIEQESYYAAIQLLVFC